MTHTGLQYKLLLKEYDKKRIRSADQKREREIEIYNKIPDIEKIDRSLNKIGINLMKQSLRGTSENWLLEYRQKNEDLIRHKKQLLVEYGYPVDYLDIHYDCPICQDTGFINDLNPTTINDTPHFSQRKLCKCFEQGLINLAYRQSNLKNILASENFSTFRFDVYSDEIHPVYGESPRDNMKDIYQVAVAFTEQFDSKKANLLLHGPTGLGKTFLCNCIAKEILDQGFSVLYLSSQELFKLFEESRFHRDDMEEDSINALSTLFDVDLLVIDDFGTETQNSFTAPDLFHVINTRFLNKKSTILSTNLAVKELKSIYSDRIISRLFGNYTVCGVFGDDIRLLKYR